jgi:hypothetical protein
MAQENGVSLDFIGAQLAGLREDVKAFKDAVNERLEQIEKRLGRVEHSQDRFRVRIALAETRDKDLTGDLAAIARIIEAAGLTREKR